eukprot:scaffold67542_cov63-Phaeocystis_antarctica.AAC.6
MHLTWYSCRQGSVRSSSPTSKLPRHTAQQTSSSCASPSATVDTGLAGFSVVSPLTIRSGSARTVLVKASSCACTMAATRRLCRRLRRPQSTCAPAIKTKMTPVSTSPKGRSILIPCTSSQGGGHGGGGGHDGGRIGGCGGLGGGGGSNGGHGGRRGGLGGAGGRRQ